MAMMMITDLVLQLLSVLACFASLLTLSPPSPPLLIGTSLRQSSALAALHSSALHFSILPALHPCIHSSALHPISPALHPYIPQAFNPLHRTSGIVCSVS